MRIAYMFMTFPMAVQPWAISDVQALEARGERVDSYALRGRQPEHAEMVSRYGLELPPLAHPSGRTALAFLRPRNLAMTAFLAGYCTVHLGRRPGELFKSLLLLPRIVEIAARLRDDPPDVVHAFWGHYPALILFLARRFFPTVHRSLFLGNYDLTPRPFGLAARAAAVADSVWTLADVNLPLLRRLGVPMEKVTVARRGIPLDLAAGPRPDKVAGRICTAANFQREKNIDLVIRSFAQVVRARPDATLVVVGDGAQRAELEALGDELGLGDRVTFTGMLERAHLFAEMRRAEVFVFLSMKASERLPNVVMEAMLAEAFCVVSPTDDIEQLVTNGVTGEIVGDLTPEGVAGRLVAALDDPARAAIGARAADHVRTNFSADALMGLYADGWRRALEARAATARDDALVG